MIAGLILISLSVNQDGFVHSKTSEYTVRTVGDFTVYVSPAAMSDKQGVYAALGLLDTKLSEVKRVVPGKAYEHLTKVKIWIERNNPGNRGAVYHPSAKWLEDNHYNTDKEKSVEIGNILNFVDWATRTQPMMVLHELAHAYHHQVVGYGNKTIKDAYEKAKSDGIYEKVNFVSGGEKKAYAMNNAMEYFAESSEAYFGVNDYFPFDRWQLVRHDRPMYEALVTAWGLPRGQSMVVGTEATPDVLKSIGRSRG